MKRKLSAAYVTKKTFFWTFIYVAALLIVIFAVVPFLWTIFSSLKLEGDIYNGEFFPSNPTFRNYIKVYHDEKMRSYFVNTIVLSFASTLVSTIVAILGSYGFSRYNFPGKNALLGGILFTRVLPRVTMLVPFFIIISKMQLVNTRLSLVLVYLLVGMPVCVWLMKGYIDGVPYEVEEAAKIDGCGAIGSLIKVVIPMVLPAIAAIAMFAFILSWNEFLFPRVLTTVPDVRPASVGLALYIDDVEVQWGMLMAASVVMAIPAIAVFGYAQKYIVSGMSEGAVKG